MRISAMTITERVNRDSWLRMRRANGRSRGARMSVRAMTFIWEHQRDRRGAELLVALAMADCAADDGTHIFPSMATLARKARIGVRQARRIVGKLEKSGLLIREKSGAGRGNRPEWRMNLLIAENRTAMSGFTRSEKRSPASPFSSEKTGRPEPQNRTDGAPKTGQNEPKPRGCLLHDPSGEPSKERERARDKSRTPARAPRKLLTAWPEKFELTPEMAAYAKARGIDARAEFEALRDHCACNDERNADWSARWRTWVRRAVELGKKNSSAASDSSPYATGAGEQLKRDQEAIERGRALAAETPEQRAAAVERVHAIVASSLEAIDRRLATGKAS